MTKDMEKTKAQLVDELRDLRGRIEEIEAVQQGREAAEERLREAGHIIESASSVIATASLDGKMTYVNPAFLDLWGFDDPAEVLGRPFTDFWLVEDQLDEIMHALHHEGKWSSEIRACRKDGTLFDVQVSAATVYDREGQPVALMSSSVDITERKQAEEALCRERDFSTSLIQTSPAFIVVIARDGKTMLMNGAMLDALGYDEEEVIGQDYLAMFVPAREHEVLSRVFQSFQQEEYSRSENHVLTKNGQELLVDWYGKSVLNDTGEMEHFFGIGLDITERKRAEQERRSLEVQVQHSQKLESLGVLAGGIAHDFNNILLAILGNADLALQYLSEVSPARPLVKEVEKAARRAADLTRQMLAYSGKGRFEVKELDLSELADEMAHLLKSSISKKVILNTHLSRNLPAIKADAVQLQQIVMNLITNASEAFGNEAAGLVSIGTGVATCDEEYLAGSQLPEKPAPGNFAYLEVSDNGCGMSDETKAKLFDPFFTTKFSGRGLGMAAVLGIVRGHSGAIMMESEMGAGTTIRVLFPTLDEALAEGPEEGKGSDTEVWRGQGTILLVDDEDPIRKLGARMLERMGFDVLTAADGREAIDLFQQCPDEISCVVLDLSMPHMNGEETFHELRRIKDDVRVVLSSGYSEQDIDERFAGQDIAGFIQKPYNSTTFKEKIKHILDI